MKIQSHSFLKLLTICHALTLLDGAKILVLFPMPFKSHIRTFSPLVEELARRGHEVTMVTSFPLAGPIPNYREIVIDKEMFGYFRSNLADWSDMSSFKTMYLRWHNVGNWTGAVLASEPMQRLISSHDEYDVILGQFFMHQHALLAFGHRFNAPLIELCPQNLPLSYASFVGNPSSVAYIPDYELPYIERMSFLERLHNTIWSLFIQLGLAWYKLPKQEEIARRQFRYPGSETRPPLRDLIRNISLVLVNSHFAFHSPRPLAPNVIEIGGFHLKPTDALPPDLQSFMDSSPDGVVFVSFGTNIQASMWSKEKEKMLASVLKALNRRVLWRWDNPEACDNSSKVMIRDWMPQQSILEHPNCVLFITHGGISSLIETVNFGVPVIGVPFMIDQFHNVDYMEQSGIGIKMDFRYMTKETLLQAAEYILNTPKFRERIKPQSELVRDQPESPLNRAVFWIEYVIRHKGAHHLKPASIDLPFHQYILLDVVGFIALASVLITFILWKIFSLLFYRFRKAWKPLPKSFHEKSH